MVEVVPHRLFFSRLTSGDRQVSCHVRLAASGQSASLNWGLRGEGGRHVIAFDLPLTKEERQRGRAWVSVVLPQDWPRSVLTVELGYELSRYDVCVFDQAQNFSLPLVGQVLVVGGHRIGEAHRAAFDLSSQQFGWDLVGLGPDRLALLVAELSDPVPAENYVRAGHDLFGLGR